METRNQDFNLSPCQPVDRRNIKTGKVEKITRRDLEIIEIALAALLTLHVSAEIETPETKAAIKAIDDLLKRLRTAVKASNFIWIEPR
jgi:hypothetical protein